jgi:phage tail tape-measure protein
LLSSLWKAQYNPYISGERMSESNPQNLDIISNKPGSHPVGAGAGAAAGAAAGVVIGAAAGPVGMAVGAIAGGIVGGLSGKGIAEQVNPTEGPNPEEHKIETGVGATIGAVVGGVLGIPAGPVGVVALAAAGAAVGDWAGQSVGHEVFPETEDARWRAAHGTLAYHSPEHTYADYRPAYALGHAHRISGGVLHDSEQMLEHSWNKVKGSSRLTWDQAKQAVHDGWRHKD